MSKKMIKRSLVLGALMAFVITGSALAAEGNPVYNNVGNNCSSIAIGADAKADNNQAADSAVAVGRASEATGQEAVAVGALSKATGSESIAVGNVAEATGFEAIAIGYNSNATGSTSIAIGAGKNVETVAYGKHSIAMGYDAESGASDANGTVAIGQQASATADGAVAVGRLSSASGNSSVAFGASTEAEQDRTTAIGYGATATNRSDLAIGSHSITKDVNNVGVTTIGGATYNIAGTDADGFIAAASFGGGASGTASDGETIYRQLQYVAAGQVSETSTDAVNGSQLYAAYQAIDATQAASANNAAAISGLNQRLDKTNAKINKVGAGAAALAALHPLEYDPDDKLTFSAGVGNYAGENAAALGAFYRPNEKLMVSLGGTMGNGENMVNLGVSIGLDKPNGYAKMSKRELIQEVNAVKAENEAMKDKLENADERIAKLEALVAKLVNK